ncbi:MAG: nucleotidyltransferase family protein [Pseudomonadota bacterium]
MAKPLMIFAAGFGTRMRPLTDNLPKPLIPIGPTTLLDHALDLASEGGADPIIVNAHYLAGQISTHLSDRNLTVVEEKPQILDTGGGLKNALPLLQGESVATLNADAAWSEPSALEQAWHHWDPSRMDALLLLVRTDRAEGHIGTGDVNMSADGHLSFRSGADADYVFTGLHICKRARILEVEDTVFSLKRVWEMCVARGTLFGALYSGRWCDVGHPDAIPIAEQMILGQVHV